MDNKIDNPFVCETDELDESEKKEIIIPNESKGERIDAFLAASKNITRSAAARLCEGGRVCIDDKAIAKNYKLRGGEMLCIDYPPVEPADAQPENIPLDIIYEDDDIIVVNKPSGMVVHPAAGNPNGTLVNALLYHCGKSLSGIGGVIRPGIVHRIDKDISGLLVVAKNDDAHIFLSEQIKRHDVSRIYYAIACGNVKSEE